VNGESRNRRTWGIGFTALRLMATKPVLRLKIEEKDDNDLNGAKLQKAPA